MSASLGSTTYTGVTWTYNDLITEAKLDNMVANDQAYDSHEAQGLVVANAKSFGARNAGDSAYLNLAKLDASDDLVLGDSGVGLSATNLIADEDDMSSDSADKLATQQSIKAYVDNSVGSSYFYAYKSADQSNLTNNTWTQVTYENTTYNVGSDYSTTTDTYTTPVNGVYQFVATVGYQSVVVDKLYKLAIKNGSSYLAITDAEPALGSQCTLQVSVTVYLDASSGVVVHGFSGSGNNLVDIRDEAYYTNFMGALIKEV